MTWRCPHRCDAAAGAGADRPAPRGVTGAGALSVPWEDPVLVGEQQTREEQDGVAYGSWIFD